MFDADTYREVHASGLEVGLAGKGPAYHVMPAAHNQ